MNHLSKLKLNTTTSMLNRITIIISGIILPRLILVFYGSEINGLIASINQFLSIISLLDLGVGSVVQSALYVPLATNDNNQISLVLTAAKNYFKKIAYVLLFYILFLILFYPFFINSQLEHISTILLIISLSVSMFTQYYFGIVNELLLNADQKGYIQLSLEIVVVILNLIASILMMYLGFSIEFLKTSTSLIYLLRPIYLTYYVNKNYDLSIVNVKNDKEILPQKWSGIARHVAYTVQNSTDIIIITLFSSLDNVSVYSIYKMIVEAIKLIITSMTTGITSFYGNLLARGETKILEYYFNKIEWLLHILVTFLYGLTIVLIVPFVNLYTLGVTDVNYAMPEFSFLLSIAYGTSCLRIPYRVLIFAAGHFKQTEKASFIEAGINIILSILLFYQFGLVGLAAGTLFSMIFYLFYVVLYLSNNILERSIFIFLKNFAVDIISIICMFFVGKKISTYFAILTFTNWIKFAVVNGLLFLIISLIVNGIFYRENIRFFYKKIIQKTN